MTWVGRYLLAWVPMVPIAIANAAARELLLRRHLSELRAHQVSTLSAALWLGLYIWWVIGAWPPDSGTRAAAIGLVWLVMTLAFELLFGHYVMRHPWQRLLADYDLVAGRVWPLLLLWITVAPYLFWRLRQ